MTPEAQRVLAARIEKSVRPEVRELAEAVIRGAAARLELGRILAAGATIAEFKIIVEADGQWKGVEANAF